MKHVGTWETIQILEKHDNTNYQVINVESKLKTYSYQR